MYKYTFLLTFAIACFSCQETTDPSTASSYEKAAPANNTAAIDSIRTLYRNMIDACITVDADRVMSYYSRSPQAAFIDENGTIHAGYDSVQNMFKQAFGGLQSQSEKFKDPDIQMLSNDHAMAITNGEFSSVAKDGKTYTGNLALTLIFSRESDGWKLLKVHQSLKMKGNT